MTTISVPRPIAREYANSNECNDAEYVCYSDYEIPMAAAESKFVHGLKVHRDDLEVMGCPSCHHIQQGMKHGEKRTCYQCGLVMVLFGNALCILGKVEKKE